MTCPRHPATLPAAIVESVRVTDRMVRVTLADGTRAVIVNGAGRARIIADDVLTCYDHAPGAYDALALD